MKEKYEQMALYVVLDNLNKGKKTITTKEIESITDDEEIDFLEKSKAADLLKYLEEEKIICKNGEGVYSIVMDIATLRGMILGRNENGVNKGNNQKQTTTQLDDLLASEWTAVDKAQEKEEPRALFRELGLNDPDDDFNKNEDNDSDDGADDSSDEIEKRRAYLETRRREILRRMMTDMENDEEDDSEDGAKEESPDDPGDEEGDFDDMTPPEVYAISQALDEGVAVIQSDEDYYLIPEGLAIGGAETRFRILILDSEVYLTDDGVARGSLKNCLLDDEEINQRIDFIVARYDIGVVGDELRIEVQSPENAISCMMQLFAAIERIVADDEHMADMCALRVPNTWGSETAERAPTVSPEYIKALALVVRTRKASIGFLQQMCNIGYNHAGKIIEWMESMGYISPFDRENGRKVLISKSRFIEIYGPLDG